MINHSLLCSLYFGYCHHRRLVQLLDLCLEVSFGDVTFHFHRGRQNIWIELIERLHQELDLLGLLQAVELVSLCQLVYTLQNCLFHILSLQQLLCDLKVVSSASEHFLESQGLDDKKSDYIISQ